MDNEIIHRASKELEDLILADIGYSREQLKADVKQIREWLNQQEHLPPSRLTESDNFLEWYLTGCKGSMETTKRKLDNYYTARSHYDFFAIRDPDDPEYVSMKEMGQLAVMPYAGFNGHRLGIGRFDDSNADKFNYHALAKLLINFHEVISRTIGFCPRLYLVLDCKNVTPALVLKLNPSVTKDLFYIIQDVAPTRIMKLHFINVPSFFAAIINTIFTPFLPNKVKERFQVTSGSGEDILNYFSPEIVPSDYGGVSTNPTLKDYSDVWRKYEQNKKDWFLNELSERNDESKRIIIDGIPHNPYFGVHGSLKKLVVD